MKTTKFLSNILFILMIGSCVSLKSSSEIEQEKKNVVEKEQKEETSKILADLMIKNKAMEDQMNAMQGRFEEMDHSKKNQTFTQDDIDELRATITKQQTEMEEIKKNLDSQNKFIKQITKTLNTITKSLE